AFRSPGSKEQTPERWASLRRYASGTPATPRPASRACAGRPVPSRSLRSAEALRAAARAGGGPGREQSAGKRLSGETTQGNVALGAMLGEAAWTVARTRGSSLHAQFHRIARRRGKPKAVMAVAHSVLVVAYHILRHQQPYRDLGADYFEQRDAARLGRYHVRRLEQLGYVVTLAAPTPAA